MLSKDHDKPSQIQMISVDQLVPEDHLLRKIDKYIDFSFIYELVEDKYSADRGRPSLDPVMLIKIPLIQYLYGIKSMRQTIKEIEVNMAYRWFLGLDFCDPVPHFTTFGKNYTRRFEGTDLFEQIFTEILFQCMKSGLVDGNDIFIDSTHVKAHANKKKSKKILVAKKAARFYDEQLKTEIDDDRKEHGKKPLKDHDSDDNDKDNDDNDDSGCGNSASGEDTVKEQKVSTTDPESGWFHKGEHEEVFAYNIQTGCDKHGWILGFTVHPANEHDSKTFPSIYAKMKSFLPSHIIADAGYKTPAVAKMMIDDGIIPVFPYHRPMTKAGFFRKYEYVYDEYYDCCICPNNQILKYSTTNREGYREYKSNPMVCSSCPMLHQCTLSKNHQKVVTRHLWESYMETCEEIRHSEGMKELYDLRKQTIERTFGTAKEHHSMRYTHQIGKEKMTMKVALTFACMNMKKLSRLMSLRESRSDAKVSGALRAVTFGGRRHLATVKP